MAFCAFGVLDPDGSIKPSALSGVLSDRVNDKQNTTDY
jgi:hypothetical protein